MTRDDPFPEFRINPPVTAAEIARFEDQSGLKLPKSYAIFLRWSDGGAGYIGRNSHLILFRLGELAEMNEAYQVAEYAPGFWIFGSNGGGDAYAFDMRTPAMPIVSLPFVGMDPSLAKPVAPDFKAFLDILDKA